MNFADYGKPDGWVLQSLNLNPAKDEYHFVGQDGNVSRMKNRLFDSKENLNFLGGWTIKMLTFDSLGQMWCVGKGGNVGLWQNNGWKDQGHLGGWKIKMIAFDQNDKKWCIGESGNVGHWDMDKWNDLGFIGKWKTDWLTFNLKNANQMYCVGTEGNIGLYNINTSVMESISSNVTVRCLTIDPLANRMIVVGRGGNVLSAAL